MYYLRNGQIRSKTLNPIEWDEWFDLLDSHLKISFFCTGNRIPLLSAQWNLFEIELQNSFPAIPFNLRLPALQNSLTSLLNKNRNFKGCLLTLYIHAGMENQIPEEMEALDWLVFFRELPYDHFPLNNKGIFLTPGSGDKPGSPSGTGVTREILIDVHGQVQEKSPGNILLVRKGVLYSKNLIQNRRQSAMAHLLNSLGQKINLRSANLPLTEHDLLDADEIWWVDDIRGIQWIMAYREKRYYRTMAQKMAEELNRWIRSGNQFHIGSSG